MIGVRDKIWFLREGLFAKYVVSLVGLVVFVLAVNGAMETWIGYRATRTALIDAMGEKAEATALRIEQSVAELERQISRVTRASSDTLEKHRLDYAEANGVAHLFDVEQHPLAASAHLVESPQELKALCSPLIEIRSHAAYLLRGAGSGNRSGLRELPAVLTG